MYNILYVYAYVCACLFIIWMHIYICIHHFIYNSQPDKIEDDPHKFVQYLAPNNILNPNYPEIWWFLYVGAFTEKPVRLSPQWSGLYLKEAGSNHSKRQASHPRPRLNLESKPRTRDYMVRIRTGNLNEQCQEVSNIKFGVDPFT